MAYVITQPCCNDTTCIEVCPVDCIRPTPADPGFTTAEMLYIDPSTCIDCGACADACPVEAIFPEDQLPDSALRYLSINSDYFRANPLETSVDLEASRSLRKDPDRPPLRVAIVGAGPAACYAAEDLLARGGSVEVEIFDRLPTPWGLVRAGVAPDHPGTKKITDLFATVASRPAVGLHLNVEIGTHLTHDELMATHHAVIYANGAHSDRRLGIAGEDLPGSHPATEFVAWYNGHPDFAERTFDLTGERAVVIGNGNVALDIARILVADPEELARTDIADQALQALRHSNIREVVVFGRRGPAQAGYTNPEFMALEHLPGVDIVIDPLELDLAASDDTDLAAALKTVIAREYTERLPRPGNKRIVMRYLVSPTAIVGTDRVDGIELVSNELVSGTDGQPIARPTGTTETMATSLVLRSIGYRGTPVTGVPFDQKTGTIPNSAGRVLDSPTGMPVTGIYTTGWIKRGPSGTIGTNRHCARETVDRLLEDYVDGKLAAATGDRAALEALLARRPDAVDYRGWKAIDLAERERGRSTGRPRNKFTDVDVMVALTKR